MILRRLLAAGGIVIAVLVVALGVAGVFREDLILWALTPGGEFDATQAAPAPAYADPGAWAALPDGEDPADLVPPGASLADRQATAPADAFFIHPTTYYSGASWNAPMDDAAANFFTDVTMAVQASAFNGCCRVYAPRYRQATLASFMVDGSDGRRALDLAYQDVVRAFEYYIENLNDGRPFIVASHSQGTAHATRLMEEVVRTASYRDRLVAAYLVGYRVPVDKFTRTLEDVPACERPAELGCVVGWDTYLDGHDPAAEARRAQGRGDVGHWYPTGYEPAGGKRWLCTNPLSWTRGQDPEPASFHLGAVTLPTSERGGGLLSLLTSDASERPPPAALAQPISGLLGARCGEGVLYIPKPDAEAFNRIVLPGGSYHMYDYGLFYMNIRRNARDRVEAFLRSRVSPSEALPATASPSR
jgi:hypothetical protein